MRRGKQKWSEKIVTLASLSQFFIRSGIEIRNISWPENKFLQIGWLILPNLGRSQISCDANNCAFKYANDNRDLSRYMAFVMRTRRLQDLMFRSR